MRSATMAVFAVAETVASMFRILRITILLFIFTGVALGSWRAKIQSVEWKYALPVNIYSLAARFSAGSPQIFDNGR